MRPEATCTSAIVSWMATTQQYNTGGPPHRTEFLSIIIRIDVGGSGGGGNIITVTHRLQADVCTRLASHRYIYIGVDKSRRVCNIFEREKKKCSGVVRSHQSNSSTRRASTHTERHAIGIGSRQFAWLSLHSLLRSLYSMRWCLWMYMAVAATRGA